MSKWYILQVYSGQEQKVKVQIEGQTLKKGLRENIEEILIPSEEVIEMKKGKKVNSERRFLIFMRRKSLERVEERQREETTTTLCRMH